MIFALLWCTNLAYSEENSLDKKVDKNAFYVNPGTAVVWHSTTAYYERILSPPRWNKNTSAFVKTGLGYMLEWSWDFDTNYLLIPAQYGLLSGKNADQFEAGAGLV
ncbi:MAG: hypothetical protein H8E61_05625 [Bacteroidetes bacterium]|nr:hypothetical protein [Bacteroidota bacterium]